MGISSSELIINSDGSIFHLHLKPGQLAKKIVLVGDIGRVELVKNLFDSVLVDVQNREFRTVTGNVGDTKISVISTGIGTDNVDIVLTEVDALFNVDFETRTPKSEAIALDIIRVGTCGCVRDDIDTGEFAATAVSIGTDGLLNYYNDISTISDSILEDSFIGQMSWNKRLGTPYVVSADQYLLGQFMSRTDGHGGVTLTASGFYGPQGRSIRLKSSQKNLIDRFADLQLEEYRGLNIEMESSAVYGLSKLLGHRALTVCVVVASRSSKTVDVDYKKRIIDLIEVVINIFTDER